MMVTYNDLKERRVLVTGATRGIGKEIAKQLAKQGAHVVFNYREGKEAVSEEMKKELIELGASAASPLMFDVTNSAQIKTAIDTFSKEVGAI